MGQSTDLTFPTRYLLVTRFSELTGYTDKAVRRKIEDGVWVEGSEWRRCPDGRIVIDIVGFTKWVESRGAG